jgi:queuine/archaeosine tRNA-ribosyltransferase
MSHMCELFNSTFEGNVGKFDTVLGEFDSNFVIKHASYHIFRVGIDKSCGCHVCFTNKRRTVTMLDASVTVSLLV